MAKSSDKRKRAKPAKPGRGKAAKVELLHKPTKASIIAAERTKAGKRRKLKPKKRAKVLTETLPIRPPAPLSLGPAAVVLDRLWSVVVSRRTAAPAVSHSARLLSRGTAKVAQKFGEEAVECLIEAVAGNRDAVVAESADVLYHLIVLWVSAGVSPDEVWAELKRREGVSGIAEKASRAVRLPVAYGLETTKIP
jgi:phosphoribosyl-ATP pyrophosphohydrolase